VDQALLAEFCDEYTRHLNSCEPNLARRGVTKQRENIIHAIKDGVPATDGSRRLATMPICRRSTTPSVICSTSPAPARGILLVTGTGRC
jgi:hypothetical protein